MDNKHDINAQPEVIEIVEILTKEKGLPNELIFEIIESTMAKIAASKYGYESDIRVSINRKNGAIIIKRYWQVVENSEDVEDINTQITMKRAKEIDKMAEVGKEIFEELPRIEFTRNTAQSARQLINKSISAAEKEKEYELYKDKVGQIVSGVVKRIENNYVVIDLGQAEGYFLRRMQGGGYRERFSIAERIRAEVVEVERSDHKPQIILSRYNNSFIAQLFAQEIPEVYDNVVEIASIARDFGSRTKVAVKSNDPSVDPVSICIGFKGSKIQGVLAELKGEKIDVVKWSEDLATYIVNAFSSISVSKVILDEKRNFAEVIVPDGDLSLAIGRAGQNVRLVSKLIDIKVDILSETQEKEKRKQENEANITLFVEALEMDNVMSQLLVLEGYKTPEDLKKAEVEQLARIQGFSEELAVELKRRVDIFLEQKAKELEEKKNQLQIADDLFNFDILSKEQIIKLAEENIKTLADLADLSSFDLIDLLGESVLSKHIADEIILKARGVNV